MSTKKGRPGGAAKKQFSGNDSVPPSPNSGKFTLTRDDLAMAGIIVLRPELLRFEQYDHQQITFFRSEVARLAEKARAGGYMRLQALLYEALQRAERRYRGVRR